AHARDRRVRPALPRPLRGGARAADRRRVPCDPAVRRPDHPLPLERRVELDPVGRPRPRPWPGECDVVPASRRARAVPRRAERDRAAVPVWLLFVRVEGRPPVGEPLRDARRGAGAAEGARPAHALGRRAADLVPRGLTAPGPAPGAVNAPRGRTAVRGRPGRRGAGAPPPRRRAPARRPSARTAATRRARAGTT